MSIGGERLQKVLARAGVASRRHAESLIAAGRVRVNGQLVSELGTHADPLRDEITVDGRPVRPVERHTYLALHKPPGYVTTTADPQGRPTVMALVPPIAALFPVGRLDADSEGLLLLTTDGEWAQRVMHPRYGCPKEYLADVAGRPSTTSLWRLRRPMTFAPGEWTSGAEVALPGARSGQATLRVVLHEGRKRQVRRMLELVGHRVLRLRRVRIGPLALGALPSGCWRHLSLAEVQSIALEVGTQRRSA